jgi:hypothetical protein
MIEQAERYNPVFFTKQEIRYLHSQARMALFEAESPVARDRKRTLSERIMQILNYRLFEE